jgi:hypothetical protein
MRLPHTWHADIGRQIREDWPPAPLGPIGRARSCVWIESATYRTPVVIVFRDIATVAGRLPSPSWTTPCRPAPLHQTLRPSGGILYCPNGHGQKGNTARTAWGRRI